jgi:hypothetical protein
VAGRPVGATSWWRNPANVAAHHANVLLDVWLAGAPALMGVLLRSLADITEHQALAAECWRVSGGERRYTVPPAIKRTLCQLAIAHVTEIRRQTLLHQRICATERNLQRQGFSDGQIAGIMSSRIPERPHVDPPDIEKVLEIVNRRAPAVTLRRKAHDRFYAD